MYVVEMYDSELGIWMECSPAWDEDEDDGLERGLKCLMELKKEHPPFKLRLVKKEEIE